jgi:hypothetical protein
VGTRDRTAARAQKSPIFIGACLSRRLGTAATAWLPVVTVVTIKAVRDY